MFNRVIDHRKILNKGVHVIWLEDNCFYIYLCENLMCAFCLVAMFLSVQGLLVSLITHIDAWDTYIVLEVKIMLSVGKENSLISVLSLFLFNIKYNV